MSDHVYIYGEDSRLLGEAIAKQGRGDNFLEIGVGNGGNLETAHEAFQLVVGTDIFDLAKVKREFSFAEFVVSDRASCFRDEVFDLVAFNPPYVSSDEIVDKSVDGGAGGLQIPLLFLESALRVVSKNGSIIMLISGNSSTSLLTRYCSLRSLSTRKIAEKRLFFETLYVFEIRSERSG